MTPDLNSLPEAATWHYAVALLLCAAFGVVSHVARAVFNILPDRLSDRPTMDLIISDGYDWKDWLFGTEYDEAGYYRLDSLHNLGLSVRWCTFSGFLILLFSPGAAEIAAYCIDSSLAALVELFWYRVETFEWW